MWSNAFASPPSLFHEEPTITTLQNFQKTSVPPWHTLIILDDSNATTDRESLLRVVHWFLWNTNRSVPSFGILQDPVLTTAHSGYHKTRVALLQMVWNYKWLKRLTTSPSSCWRVSASVDRLGNTLKFHVKSTRVSRCIIQQTERLGMSSKVISDSLKSVQCAQQYWRPCRIVRYFHMWSSFEL